MFRVVISLIAAVFMMAPAANGAGTETATGWQTPPEEVMEVLHAPQLPRVWTSPTGENLLLADPSPSRHWPSWRGPCTSWPASASTRWWATSTADTEPPRRAWSRSREASKRLLGCRRTSRSSSVSWTADGTHFALTVREADHMGLWVGSSRAS